MAQSLSEKQIESEKIGLIHKEKASDVMAWLTAPKMGVIEPDWDNE